MDFEIGTKTDAGAAVACVLPIIWTGYADETHGEAFLMGNRDYSRDIKGVVRRYQPDSEGGGQKIDYQFCIPAMMLLYLGPTRDAWGRLAYDVLSAEFTDRCWTVGFEMLKPPK
jgi:hypothetical protein